MFSLFGFPSNWMNMPVLKREDENESRFLPICRIRAVVKLLCSPPPQFPLHCVTQAHLPRRKKRVLWPYNSDSRSSKAVNVSFLCNLALQQKEGGNGFIFCLSLNIFHSLSLLCTSRTYTVVVCQRYKQVACSPLNKHWAPLTFI